MPLVMPYGSRAREGFSMVVVAALFLAFSIVGAVVLDRNNSLRQLNREKAAAAQLQRLSNAILRFTATNSGHFPCPAQYNLTPGDANYGLSVATPVYATGCESITFPYTGIDALGGGTEVIRGMVPVVTLATYDADINDAIDPWGDKIMYVVNRILTPVGSGTVSIRPLICTDPGGTHTACATSTVPGITINPPDYLLISYGPDRLGGIPANQTTAAIACSASTVAMRIQNCNATNTTLTFLYRPLYMAANATATTGGNSYYDDLISFSANQ